MYSKYRTTKQRRKGLNPLAYEQSITVSYPEKGGRTICFLLEATWLCFAIKRDFSSYHSHNSVQLVSTQNIQRVERSKKTASKTQQQQNLICTACGRGEEREVGKRGIIH